MLKKLYPTTEKSKFMLIIFIAFVVIIGLGLYVSSLQMYKSVIDSQKFIVQSNYNLVTNLFESKIKQAGTLATMMALDSENSKAVANKDTQSLKDLTLSKYLYLKKKFNLSQFQFHLPPATSLFRAHKPEKFGDDLTKIRQGVVDCNNTQKAVGGIEKGRFGFGLRAIVPVFHDTVHVGSVEFGFSINDALVKHLKEGFEFDISIVIPDDGGFKYLAKTHSLGIPQKSYPWLEKMMKENKIHFKQVEKNNKNLVILFAPLKDYKGNNVGVLAIPRDVTSVLKQFKNKSLKMMAAGFGLLLGLLLLFYFIYDIRINKPVTMIITKINQVVAGDFTALITENMPEPKDSPVAKGDNKRCWETIGDFSIIDVQCPRILDGTYKKCQDCTHIFQKVRMGEFQELSSYFNALVFTLQKLVSDIKKNSELIFSASDDLSKAARETQQGVEKSAEKAGVVANEAEAMSADMNSMAAASEETSTNIDSVTGAARQMGENIAGIAEKTEKAKEISHNAVDQTKRASDKVASLSNAARDISKVTEVISDISEQTNLLALNATIEAARAGEAGKGFAVVAAEIKELAKQTFGATNEIKEKVKAIQNSTDDTTKGIMETSGVIGQVNEIIVSITKDMEEQSMATEQIITNMSEAAQGLGEVNETVANSSSSASKIAEDIEQISKVSMDMSQNAKKITDKSKGLTNMAENANNLTSKFKV